MPAVWIWLLLAVVAGWMVQLYVTYNQATAFNKQVVALRRQGTVSVGSGGRRYRGGKAFVAVAIDDTERVVDAIVLQGFTTFARGKLLPALIGVDVSRLGGDGEIPELSGKQREAARQAATLFFEARKSQQRREAERGATEKTG